MTERSALSNNLDDKNAFTVPCIPLQNTVKFPSDFLNMNLHERRHLQLAEHVLNSENRTFGVFYSGNKNHTVHDRIGDFTPRVEIGDHGVLCEIINHRYIDVDIPSHGSRRKLVTRSVVTGRFEVTSVVRTGIAAVPTKDGTEEDNHGGFVGGANSYIILRARNVEDAMPQTTTELHAAQEADYRLWALIQEISATVRMMGEGTVESAISCPNGDEECGLYENMKRYVHGSTDWDIMRHFAPANREIDVTDNERDQKDEKGGKCGQLSADECAPSLGNRDNSKKEATVALERIFSLGVATTLSQLNNTRTETEEALLHTRGLDSRPTDRDEFVLSEHDVAEARKRQLFSFTVARTLGQSIISLERQSRMLETSNTTKRLIICEDSLRGGLRWLKARRALKDLLSN